MRYLKKFESKFNLDAAVVKIGQEYGKDRVVKMVDDEKKEWSEDYDGIGNGEAEEMVIHSMIGWYKKDQAMGQEDRKELESALRGHYFPG
jgi:hypothetical protein